MGQKTKLQCLMGGCALRNRAGGAWCLPCGFDHIVPYFYVIYFGALLGAPQAPIPRCSSSCLIS